MNKNTFHGILYAASGSLWWGTLGVLYFKSVSFAGPIELVIHRTIWTAFTLIITTSLFSKWNNFYKVFKNKKSVRSSNLPLTAHKSDEAASSPPTFTPFTYKSPK